MSEQKSSIDLLLHKVLKLALLDCWYFYSLTYWTSIRMYSLMSVCQKCNLNLTKLQKLVSMFADQKGMHIRKGTHCINIVAHWGVLLLLAWLLCVDLLYFSLKPDCLCHSIQNQLLCSVSVSPNPFTSVSNLLTGLSQGAINSETRA